MADDSPHNHHTLMTATIVSGRQGGRELAQLCVQLLGLAIAMLLAINVVFLVLRYGVGIDASGAFGYLFYLFNPAEETNVASWASSLMMSLCAGLLAAIGVAQWRERQQGVAYWAVLAAIFVLMSLDETASIHEKLTEPMQALIAADHPLLTNAWVVAAAPVLLVLAAVYLRWLVRLPRAVAVRFVIAGAVFVGGAVGVELFSGAARVSFGYHSLGFFAVTMVEEGCEYLGLWLFVRALVLYCIDEQIVRTLCGPGQAADADAIPDNAA